MSQINTNAILDASGGTTTTVNGFTPTASNMAGRNLIINGDMRIAQRGTSLSSYSSGNDVKVLDRWKTAPVTAGTWTLSQESDAPDGFSNSLKFLCTTANSSLSVNSNLGINQLFEGLNLTSLAKGTSSAKSLTLSMWVKSNKTGTYVAELFDSNNSRSISATYTISSSDVWEYKTIVFVGDTSGALTFDNTQAMRLTLWLVAGTNYTSGTLATSWESSVGGNRAVGQINLADTLNNYFSITGVQLEAGSVATPFEYRQYGQELALCQRYYQSTYDYLAGDTPASNVNAGCVDFTPINASDFFNFNYFLRMRTAPSVTTYRKNGGATNQAQRADNSGTYINISTNVITAVGFDVSPTTAQSRNYRFHWVAEAEL